MPDFKPEMENLFRGRVGGFELRADDSTGGTTLAGNFTVFNEWTEINSLWEGDFVEQIDKAALRKTVKENVSQMRVQFDHGYDTFVGSAPLGPIDILRDDAYYEVPLLDTDYNRDRVLPMLQGRTMDGQMRGSVLGASFRFRVVADEWNWEPDGSDYNPKQLPERTIKEVRLFEFGPVVFPAYPGATAGMRSLSDHFLDRAREARSSSGAATRHATTTPTTEDGPPPEHPELTGRATALAINTLQQLRRAS